MHRIIIRKKGVWLCRKLRRLRISMKVSSFNSEWCPEHIKHMLRMGGLLTRF